jgi:hypothetical protein
MKTPNDFGLYDTSGNLWEFCQDWYHDNYIGAPVDGSAWVTPPGTYRVIRGGDWQSLGSSCRSAARWFGLPTTHSNRVGFRLAAALFSVDPCSLTCTAAVPGSARAGVTISFQAMATSTGCTDSPAFLWNFGDGSSSADPNVDHAYSLPGEYSWSLTVQLESETCLENGIIAVSQGLPGDCSADGQVSIGEVQKVINAFLGVPAAC